MDRRFVPEDAGLRMIETADGIASVVEQLNQRLRELEQRIFALESRADDASPAHPVAAASQAQAKRPAAAPNVAAVPPLQRPKPPATWRGFPTAEAPAGAVTVVGKAVLGIAGAYLLRAIAESGAVPKLPVLMVAIVYAYMWMVWAVRSHVANPFASVTYATTSALILAPLLWESTVRFEVLSPGWSGDVLVAYVVLVLALTWRRDLQLIPLIATLATVITALALIFATHELVQMAAVLLAVALAIEITACLGHSLNLRAVPAIAADFAVWMLVDVMALSKVVPEGYHATSPATLTALCLGLLAIYGGSIGVRSFGLRQRISIFDIGQVVLAFALATFGALRATQGSSAPALGLVFLLLAAVCYWGALSRFVEELHTRNRRVAATWAAALLLGGSLLLFPPSVQVPYLCLAAVVAAYIYSRNAKFSLGLHASLFLAAAASVSPMPAYVMDALAGNVPGAPAWSVWIVAVSAALCYAVGSRGSGGDIRRRLLWVVPALLVGFAFAAIAVGAIVGLAAGRAELAASRLSVVRTIVDCAVALALGYFGSRWRRVELGWVAYAAVGFGTLKLLFEDLRFGNAASLVVSLLFFGGVLILLPKMMQRGRKEAVEAG